MNERIAELYNQAIVLEGNGDYVAGELDPVKFAELIIRRCAGIDFRHKVGMTTDQEFDTSRAILEHFGIAE